MVRQEDLNWKEPGIFSKMKEQETERRCKAFQKDGNDLMIGDMKNQIRNDRLKQEEQK